MKRIMMCLLVCGIFLLSGCNRQPTDEELGRKEVLPDCGPEQIKAMPKDDPNCDASERLVDAPQVEVPGLRGNRFVPLVRPVTFTYMVPYDPVREITRRDEKIRILEAELDRIQDIVILLNREQPELLHMPRECPLNDEGDDE